MELGLLVTDAVLGVAKLLVQPSSPGYAALALISVFAVLAFAYCVSVMRQWRALKFFFANVKSAAVDGRLLADTSEIDYTVQQMSSSRFGRRVAETWHAYRQSTLHDQGDDESLLLGTTRPSSFWNADDLKMDHASWRIVPGVFVSVGLFLTFLGLVAALTQTENLLGSNGDPQEGLKQLLTTASAKFIMSLTGLACSIVFGLLLRFGHARIANEIAKICSLLERLVPLVSLEAIAHQQLLVSHEQKDISSATLSQVADDLRAGIEQLPHAISASTARLYEELPKVLSESIAKSLVPVFDELKSRSNDGLADLVKGLGEQLSGDVNRALQTTSAQLAAAGDRLSSLINQNLQQSSQGAEGLNAVVDRLSQSVSEMQHTSEEAALRWQNSLTDGVQTLLSAMSTSLQEIQQNTSVGAAELSVAARELGNAAGKLKADMSSVSDECSAQMRQELAKITSNASNSMDHAQARLEQQVEALLAKTSHASQSIAETLSEEIVLRIEAISNNLTAMNQQLVAGTREFMHLNDGMREGAQSFRQTTELFSTAVQPILESSCRQERMLAGLEQTVSNLQISTEKSATTAHLSYAAVASAAEAVSTVTTDFARQAERLDDMDASLGKAFEAYAANVEGGLDLLKNHVREISTEIAPAIDRMREVVVYAEKFVPTSQHRVVAQ